ncbi:MAG TPA: nuclear transport factor 2 family protein [Solirubrobacteraceae bacterium]|nr:nuclear transport factor 2 family protein [Solirubrobacteraceae bacterium]
MTPAEKLALTQRSYAAFSPPDIEALIPLYHSGCEWRMGSMGAALGAEAFRGHDGLRELVAAVLEGADSWAAEIVEARIRRDGVLLIDYINRLQTSGYTHMELTYKGWQEIEVRDGLIASVAQFEHAPPGWDGATPLNLGLTPDTGT